MVDAVVLARHLLADIDQEVRGLDAKLVSGVAQEWVAYRELVARRAGVLAIRRALVERLSQEQRQFLGLRPD